MPAGPHRPSEECRRIFALLSEYLDAELPLETCDEIEAHLSDCPPCVEFLESLRRTVEVCRSFEPGEMPGPLSEEVRAELRQLYEKALRGRPSAGAP
jgi:anti-sigma factor RsiW